MLRVSSYLDTELKTVHASSCVLEGWRVTASGHKVSFGRDENILKFDYGDDCTIL